MRLRVKSVEPLRELGSLGEVGRARGRSGRASVLWSWTGTRDEVNNGAKAGSNLNRGLARVVRGGADDFVAGDSGSRKFKAIGRAGKESTIRS